MVWSAELVVLIATRRPGRKELLGSGTWLGAKRVLTARHVVLGSDGRLTPNLCVGSPENSNSPGARVVWCGAGGIDVAVLEIFQTGDAANETMDAAELFSGRDIQTGERWEARGYPSVRTINPSERIEAVSGTTVSYSSQTEKTLTLDATVHPDVWGGLSGSAVVIGGKIVGVVRAVPIGWGGARLEATPVSTFLADAGFREALNLSREVPPQLLSICATRIHEQIRSVGRKKYERGLFVARESANELRGLLNVEATFRVESAQLIEQLEIVSHNFGLDATALPPIREARRVFEGSLSPVVHERALSQLQEAFYVKAIEEIERRLGFAIHEKISVLFQKRLDEIRQRLQLLPFIKPDGIDDFIAAAHALGKSVAAGGAGEDTPLHRTALALLPSLPRPDVFAPVILATELVRRLGSLLLSHHARCSVIVASAGRGKTNILCNFAEEVARDSPVILLSGRMFISSEGGIADLIEREFSSTFPTNGSHWMDCVTSSLNPSRGWLYILIDGVNENDNPKLMARALEVFLARCEGQRIRVILSCRDILWELFSRSVAPFIHQGTIIRVGDFDDDEWDVALGLYGKSYDVTFPLRSHALNAMKNPILLRFFCEAHRGQQLRDVGDVQLAGVFAEYLHNTARRVAERLSILDHHVPINLLLRIGEQIWKRKNATVDLADLGLTPESAAPVDSLYGQLRSEGIIFEEVPLELGSTKVIRIVYDEFMEYLIARAWVRTATATTSPSHALHSQVHDAVASFIGFAPAWGALMFLDQIENSQGTIVNEALEAFAALGDELMASRQAALLVAFENMSIIHLDDRVVSVLARFEELASPEIKERLALILNEVLAGGRMTAPVLELARKILEAGPVSAGAESSADVSPASQERSALMMSDLLDRIGLRDRLDPHVVSRPLPMREQLSATLNSPLSRDTNSRRAKESPWYLRNRQSTESLEQDVIHGLPPARHHYSHQVRLTAMTLLANSNALEAPALLEEGARKMGTLDLHSALETMEAVDGASDDVAMALVRKHMRASLPEYRVYCAWLLRGRYGEGPAEVLLTLLTDEHTRVHRFTFRLFRVRKIEGPLLTRICERLEDAMPLHSWHLVHLLRLLGCTQQFVIDPAVRSELRHRIVTALHKHRQALRAAVRIEAYKALFHQEEFINKDQILRLLEAEDDVYLRRFAAAQRSLVEDSSGVSPVWLTRG